MDKEIAEYITETVEKIDPEISIVVTHHNIITVPVPCSRNIRCHWEKESGGIPEEAGWFKNEYIPLRHLIPGGSLGYGEQSRVLAIRWDENSG